MRGHDRSDEWSHEGAVSRHSQPRSRGFLFEDGQCVSNALIVRLSVEVPASALVVLVDLHEILAGERREVLRDATIGFAAIDTLECSPNFEVASFASLTIRIEYDLEVPITIATEARRNVAQPLALSLSMRDAGFDPLDRTAAFFLGDGRTDIGDELPGPIGSNLIDPTVGDRDRRIGRFASLEELLTDAARRASREIPQTT